MKRCSERVRWLTLSSLTLALVLGITGFSPAPAQSVIQITLDEKPPAKPTPADITRQKMNNMGTINGENWSISVDLNDVAMAHALEYVAEVARAKPREIILVVDRQSISNSAINLGEEPRVVVKANGISLAEALKFILNDGNLGYTAQEDGTVLISTRDQLNRKMPTRTYDVSQVLSALRTNSENIPEKNLQEVIEKTVRGDEPWESAGGRAALDFAPNGTMLVSAPEETQQQIVPLCRNLLVEQFTLGYAHGR